MKKFLLALFLLLISTVSFTQTQLEYQEEYIDYVPWTAELEGQWGSFWWKVERTPSSDVNGYYWFYVYFYSNSYFNTMTDGVYDKAVSYVESPSITMSCSNGTFPMILKYALVDWEKTNVAYYFNVEPNPKFHITYNRVYPYEYTHIK